MKIKNETTWRTDHIRALAVNVARRQLMDPAQIKSTIVHVRWRRGRRLGEAFLGCSPGRMTKNMWLFMDRDKIDPVTLAHTIGHEIGHMKGLEHRHMKGRPAFDYSPGWRDLYAWAAEFPIEPRPVRVRPSKPAPTPVQVAEARYAQAAAMMKSWETKAKRAQTMLKKWQRRAALRQRRVQALTVTDVQAQPAETDNKGLYIDRLPPSSGSTSEPQFPSDHGP